jgi:acetyltransferase
MAWFLHFAPGSLRPRVRFPGTSRAVFCQQPAQKNVLSSPANRHPQSAYHRFPVGEPAPTSCVPVYPLHAALRDGTPVVIRPIGPEDARREQAFVRGLSPQSRYFRFMNTLRELSPEMLERFTHPDPSREIALVALSAGSGDAVPAGEPLQIGVARCVRGAKGEQNEFAIVVADAFQRRGLGTLLMQALIQSARAAGLERVEGVVLATNQRMLALMSALGFAIRTAADDPRLRRVVKQL